MSFPAPTWRSFQNISSDAEAACAAAFCFFSLRTLEVASDSSTSNFALIEQKQPDIWRWAIISAEGYILESEWETTQGYARGVAMEALLRVDGRPVDSRERPDDEASIAVPSVGSFFGDLLGCGGDAKALGLAIV